jgi:type III secretion system FlhB-like substrate exporter
MQFAHRTDHAPRLIATGVGKLWNDLLELGEDRARLPSDTAT